MRRHRLIAATFAALAACPAGAQQAPPLIGFLSPISPAAALRNVEAFRQGLRDLGYVEGRNIAIEFRFADGVIERLPGMAAELVRLNPKVILAGSIPGVLAASRATSSIPIVMSGTFADPVGAGLIDSFAHPGRNVTGVTLAGDVGLSGKRLSLLQEMVPGLSRVGVLLSPGDPTDAVVIRSLPEAILSLKLDAKTYPVRAVDEIDAAIAAAARDGVQALWISQSPVFTGQRERIVALAAAARLPAMYGFREFVQAGGLASYGPDQPDSYRQTASFVDRILKGEKPGEIPVQNPIKFELVVNLKTAKALGLTFPPSLLATADEVIE
jgi:putative ABC transport system substrate-binding protein